MESISMDRFLELFDQAREIRKIELKDHYGIDGELFAAWQSGDIEAVEASYQRWRDSFASDYVERGRSYARVRVVSEPLSEYQRMAVTHSGVTVDIGEGLRWLPRRLASALPFPGNDCIVLDGRSVLFVVMDPNGDEVVDPQHSTDPAVVRFCVDSFHAAWEAAIPHAEYRARMITG